MTSKNIDRLVARWNGLDRPLFKGRLIDATGCKCAQGDVLSYLGGLTDDALRTLAQHDADAATAKLLGISLTHSILLRCVNDTQDGAPAIVLTNPEAVLGDQAHLVLAFWHHLDGMTTAQWAVAEENAWGASEDVAWKAALAAVWTVALAAVWTVALAGARDVALKAALAAVWTTNEIQGHTKLSGAPFFLPIFGITLDELRTLAATAQKVVNS
jgi:hypothetical protein